MSKIYCIRDILTGKFVAQSDLYGDGHNIVLCNNPVELYFESIEGAKARLKKMQAVMDQAGPAWDFEDISSMVGVFDRFYETMKPSANRLEIVEGEVKIANTNNPRHYWRIKDTNKNEYFKTIKKTNNIGKIYRTLAGAEKVATAITRTPKNKRDTKAKKLLFGDPKCANVELEPCIVEFKK